MPVIATPTAAIALAAATAVFTDDAGGSPDMTEAEIVQGTEFWRLTLSDGTFVNPLQSADQIAIIDGLVDISSAPNDVEFEKVRAGMRAQPSRISRVSDIQVRIDPTASPTYNILTDGQLRATVPASVIEVSALPVIATPDAVIQETATVTSTTSGAILSTDENTMRATGSSASLTLDSPSFVASFDNPTKIAIIDGTVDIASAGNDIEWEKIRSEMRLDPATTVVRNSNTVVSLTFPPWGTYNIASTGDIQITIPAAALEGGAPIVSAPNGAVAISGPMLKLGDQDVVKVYVGDAEVPVMYVGDLLSQ